MNDCTKWLLERLKGEECLLCDIVRVEARKEGFTRKQLKEARKFLNIETFHQFDEDGATENWFWILPKGGQ